MSQTQDITYIAYLYPHSTFRGELRSDTLWGIICWGIRFLYGKEELKSLLAEYEGDKFPFVISSAFPFYEEEKGKQKLFFPRPYLPQRELLKKEERGEGIKGLSERKKSKKIGFISSETLKKLCEGEKLDVIQAAINAENIIPVIETGASTHNTLNRLTNVTLEKEGQGQLFHTDEKYVSIPKKEEDNKEKKYCSGLFFLIRSEKHWDKIQAVLRWLAHTGIGGDRNIGKGFFDIEHSEWKTPPPANAVKSNAYMSLSLFMPNATEIEVLNNNKDHQFLNYQITFRKGFVGNGTQNFYDKKNLAAFVEGSVFPCEMRGEIKDAGLVTKEEEKKGRKLPYPIYQNGCAFMIPITINFEEK